MPLKEARVSARVSFAEANLESRNRRTEIPSTRRLNKRQRTHEAPEEGDVRSRVAVGARDVFNAVDPPIEEDMTNIGTLTVASNPFDVRAVPRTHVEDRSPSFDIDRPDRLPPTHGTFGASTSIRASRNRWPTGLPSIPT